MMSEGERGMQEGEGPRRRKTREPNSLNEATYCQNLIINLKLVSKSPHFFKGAAAFQTDLA